MILRKYEEKGLKIHSSNPEEASTFGGIAMK